MPKFLILYNSQTTASQRMEQSSPEQVKAGMETWIKWKEALDPKLKFEWGMPLGAAGRIATSGIGESDSSVGGYSMLEGDKDQVITALKSHPHLKDAGNTIDLLELLPMPGMEG